MTRRRDEVWQPDRRLRLIAHAVREGLLDDPLGHAVGRLSRLGISDSFVNSEIERRVRAHATSELFRGPFEPPRLDQGDLVLGVDERGREVRIPAQHANAHSLTVGGSGCGKTNRSRFMALQMAHTVKGVWLFDLRKEEYAAIAPPLAQAGSPVTTIRARDLRFNPLQTPLGVPAVQWASCVADLLVQALRLPPRATKLIHITLATLYADFGMRDTRAADESAFPTLFDLREHIAGCRDANTQAREAVIDSLDPILMSLGPDALGLRRGWSTHDLAQRRVIFEFGGVAEADKDLLLNSLLLSEFSSRVARGISNAGMDLWVCCDEAQRLLAPGGSSAIADLIGLVRGTGIGLDLSVQASEVHPRVLSNTSIKLLGRVGSAADLDAIGGAMALTRDQRRWIMHHLRPGLFVAQVGEGRWRKPFVLRVPEMRIPTPAAAQQVSGEVSHCLPVWPEVVAAPEFVRWSPQRKQKRAKAASAQQARQEHAADLSDQERRYLHAVREHPGLSSSEYPRLARLSTRKALEVRDRLVQKGLVRLHEAQFTPRGRPSIIVEPIVPGHPPKASAEANA